jgi:dipeptidyl aminopeptidase/acylaminoacyl peptidase
MWYPLGNVLQSGRTRKGGKVKRTLIIGAVLLFALATLSCQRSTYREVKHYTFEQFMDVTSIFGSSFSPDESKILFSSNETGIYNAYTVPVQGGTPTQLTFSENDAVFALSYFPNDNRILYMGDKGGNEIYHLYVREEDGTVKDVTPFGENARAVPYGWSYDLKSYFFGSNKRDQRFMDVYEMDIETFDYKMVYQNDEGYSFGGVSNDRKYMALTETITNHDSEMYLYAFETAELMHLTPHEGDIEYSPEDFSVDSKSLYYLTNDGSEYTYLNRYDIEAGKHETVKTANWDIMYAYFSRNGKYRILGINDDAKTVIEVLETERGKPVKLPKLPLGEITSVRIARSEKLMTFYHSGSRSPNDLYVYDFETRKYIKLTDNMNPEIDQDDLVDARVVRYKSFDGVEIPAILYRPHHIKSGEKVPALVSVHGGPGGQSRIGYRRSLQYFVNNGYVVLEVNNRGSSGYGKTFFKMDDLNHGEGDLDDCVEAKKYLASTGYVDTSKVAIIGGSYGGYMVLAALTFRPDEFAAGVDMFGISNWVRTLESIPPWWEAFREALYKEMGNPETDREYLHRISPLFHAENITRPLMVLQGANDPRVLKVESDEIVEAARANGVPVEYVVFEDEGHGFIKKENQIEGYTAILAFLDKYLKGAE